MQVGDVVIKRINMFDIPYIVLHISKSKNFMLLFGHYMQYRDIRVALWEKTMWDEARYYETVGEYSECNKK